MRTHLVFFVSCGEEMRTPLLVSMSSNLSATPVTQPLLGICKSTVKGLYCQVPITQFKHMISLALTLSPYPQLT